MLMSPLCHQYVLSMSLTVITIKSFNIAVPYDFQLCTNHGYIEWFFLQEKESTTY